MKKKTVVTKLPAGEIVKIEKLSDGTWKIVHEVVEEEVSESRKSVVSESVVSNDVFILIEAESLSMKDEVMQYEPKTMPESSTKKLIAEAIKKGVKNFYRPKYDPSFDDGMGICLVSGKRPAVGRSYNWYKYVTENHNPQRNSRLGTRLEYGAFLGVLIKKLVEDGKSVEWAWNAVCNDSCELGHYWNSKDSKHTFEPTGSRSICGFYDLANTYKILAEDSEAGGFWLAGGSYGDYSSSCPLAGLSRSPGRNFDLSISVGWLVLS